MEGSTSAAEHRPRGRPLPRLSSSVEDLAGHFSIVVIGSGYGGAITAARLARAGQPVCVLERGREFHPGEYPDTAPEYLEELQLHTNEAVVGRRTALYDLRLGGDVSVFMGCGLGGTSLINANVALRADPRVFDDPCWPEELRANRDGAIDRGYQRAIAMLQPHPLPDRHAGLKKLEALAASSRVFSDAEFYRPDINVTFEHGPNAAGIEQHACALCGDCVTGCNFGAKNTLLMNYLPDAHAHGAKIFTQVAVRYLERRDDHWIVQCQLLDTGREHFDAPLLPITADLVVLSAGTLGSTEILLRSAAQSELSLSAQLGNRFTGNGDVLAFSYNGDLEVDGVGWGHLRGDHVTPVGPCITGVIDRRAQRDLDDGIVIEEGVIPGALAASLPGEFAALRGLAADAPADSLPRRERELASLVKGARAGALRNTQTYLVMAHDDGAGRLVLIDDRLTVQWPGAGDEPIYQTIDAAVRAATEPLGGVFIRDPLWTKLLHHELITVHPLGGCAMASDAEHGVVNHKGQVFSGPTSATVYDNLYVTDGSVVPRPLGVNPLLTISALAERCVERMAADRGWTIDYESPTPDPAPGPPRTIGIEFTERMSGWASTVAPVPDDFEEAARRGQAADSSVSFVVTIATDDLDRMLIDPEHEARIVGTVTAPGVSSEPLAATEGRFNLFVKDPSEAGLVHMKYRMTLTTTDGHRYLFTGVKHLRHDRARVDLWSDTTTLYVTIHDGDRETDPITARGILRIRPTDFAQQLRATRAINAPNTAARLKAEARFGEAFAGELYHLYGGLVARRGPIDSGAPPRKKRPLRVDPPTRHHFTTDDGVELVLARYQGGTKGPVMLTHGLGVSSLIFAVDTIDTSLLEFLYARGYDVWLLDYRASIDLEASKSQFTADDIALHDYPAAVDQVRAVTGAPSVQIVAHCFGSTTFVMAMLAGLEGVRSAVCSQIATNVITPRMTRFKAAAHVPRVLEQLGFTSLTADATPDERWAERLFDQALRLYPATADERCTSPVCHRISFLYGRLYQHAQLDPATHDTLHELFGVANMSAFEHLATMIRHGTVVAADGADTYMPHLDRLAIPLTIIQGAKNVCYLPASTAETLDLLRRANDPNLYRRQLIAHYGHIDCIIGKDAARDVYPFILSGLEPTALT